MRSARAVAVIRRGLRTDVAHTKNVAVATRTTTTWWGLPGEEQEERPLPDVVAGSTSDGAAVEQRASTSGDEQVWLFVPSS